MITAFSEQLITIDELRARMPALRARETGLKDQIAALDAQAADRDAYLRLAGDLEGFLGRLRQSSATATTEDRQRVLRAVVQGAVLVGPEKITIRHRIPVREPASGGGHHDKTIRRVTCAKVRCCVGGSTGWPRSVMCSAAAGERPKLRDQVTDVLYACLARWRRLPRPPPPGATGTIRVARAERGMPRVGSWPSGRRRSVAGTAGETVVVLGTRGGQMRYADAGGVRIAYDDEGPRADDAVVFLPGWCNSGRSFFALLAERLAARHRVIRLDWRGHGDSSRPGTDFSHDELADDAMAVIEAAGLRSVVLVTQAHGGWPAIRLGRRLGDRVTKIIVLSWMVLDPPPTFMAVFGMLQDPGGGGRVSTSSWPGGWPGLRKTCPNGSAGRRAATASTCGRGQRVRLRRTTLSTATRCAQPRNWTTSLTCCTCSPSRAPPGSSPGSRNSRLRTRGSRLSGWTV